MLNVYTVTVCGVIRLYLIILIKYNLRVFCSHMVATQKGTSVNSNPYRDKHTSFKGLLEHLDWCGHYGKALSGSELF